MNRFTSRKIVHIASLTLCLAVINYLLATYGQPITLRIAGGILAIVALCEFLRADYGWFGFARHIIKQHEKHAFSALTLALASGVIVLAIFPPTLALGALACALYGDAAAALIGTLLGRHRITYNRSKTWEGAGANLIIGTLAALVFVDPTIALAMGIVSSVLESSTIHIEDNFLIPLICAFIGSLL